MLLLVVVLLGSASGGDIQAHVGYGVEILVIVADLSHGQALMLAVRVELIAGVASCGGQDARIVFSNVGLVNCTAMKLLQSRSLFLFFLLLFFCLHLFLLAAD